MILLKSVKCIDCGFLGDVPIPEEYTTNPLVDFSWEKIEEIPPHWREVPKYISGESSPVLIGCYMRQFHQLENAPLASFQSISDETIKALTKKRKCQFFYKYHPGYTPVEHKEFLTQRNIFRTNIISAIIGALFATIVNILWNLLT